MATDNKELKEDVKEVKQVVHELVKTIAEHKVTLQHQIENDRNMFEEFRRLNDILQQNTDSLKEHMHRTNLLEKSVQTLDERLCPVEVEIIGKKAVKEWMKDNAILVAKISGGLGTLVTAYMTLRHLIH
jgi:predicted nuclease with TOPRIM domain